jgi:hypothetical protein
MAAARHDLHALVSVDEGGHIYSAPTVERVKEEPEALRGAQPKALDIESAWPAV